MYEDFAECLKINKYRLEEECLSQPNLYYVYSEKAQEAKTLVSKCEDYLKLTLADAQLIVRNEYTAKGIKFTEAVVSAEVEKMKSVLEAREELRKAQDMYGKAMVAVSAIETKRSELDNLVKLFCAGYFSTTEIGNKVSDKQIRTDIRKGLKEIKDREIEE